jgi:NADPH:quinone reductase-like Zn-dependent oxidoreductase
MKAAGITSYRQAPAFGDFHEPQLQGDEVLVSVHAAAQSQLVKAIASGKHYSSKGIFPFVPGVDGVGVLGDGTRVYFGFPRAPFGAMAERVPVAADMWVKIPDSVDDVTAAAIANPAMSSWAALTERAKLRAGESVLINGATGISGRLAVLIAKHLGAKHVVATGRNAAILAQLAAAGADACIALEGSPDEVKARFKEHIAQYSIAIVLDYLWGEPAEHLLAAIAGRDHDHASETLRFVQIGNSAGPSIALPGGTLRSNALELMGSGLGSVPLPRLVQIIGQAFTAIGPAGLSIQTDSAPLADVEKVWHDTTAGRRVFVS